MDNMVIENEISPLAEVKRDGNDPENPQEQVQQYHKSICEHSDNCKKYVVILMTSLVLFGIICIVALRIFPPRMETAEDLPRSDKMIGTESDSNDRDDRCQMELNYTGPLDCANNGIITASMSNRSYNLDELKKIISTTELNKDDKHEINCCDAKRKCEEDKLCKSEECSCFGGTLHCGNILNVQVLCNKSTFVNASIKTDCRDEQIKDGQHCEMEIDKEHVWVCERKNVNISYKKCATAGRPHAPYRQQSPQISSSVQKKVNNLSHLLCYIVWLSST